MLNLKKWLEVKDHKIEMIKSFIEGKTIAEISIEFNRPVTCVRYHMAEYMPSLDDIDAFKRKFAAKKLKTKRYE